MNKNSQSYDYLAGADNYSQILEPTTPLLTKKKSKFKKKMFQKFKEDDDEEKQ